MPKRNGAGESRYTPLKQSHFREILETQTAIVREILKKGSNWNGTNKNYWYYDLYSGGGFTAGQKGSPLIFIETMKKFGLKYRAFFYDENKENAFNLSKLLGNDLNSHIFHSNNSLVLSNNNGIGFTKYGLVYTDPNGTPDFDVLHKLFLREDFKKIDLLINMSATAVKRALNCKTCKDHTQRLAEYLSMVNKNFWIIREPYDKWQWIFLIGTNWNAFPRFKHLGFYDLKSKDGSELLKYLNTTQKERGYGKSRSMRIMDGAGNKTGVIRRQNALFDRKGAL